MNSNIKLPLVQDDLLNDSAISTASPEDMNALLRLTLQEAFLYLTQVCHHSLRLVCLYAQQRISV